MCPTFSHGIPYPAVAVDTLVLIPSSGLLYIFIRYLQDLVDMYVQDVVDISTYV